MRLMTNPRARFSEIAPEVSYISLDPEVGFSRVGPGVKIMYISCIALSLLLINSRFFCPN